MELTNTKETMQNGYDSLLLGYAAGILDQAQMLAVDTHLSFSKGAQQSISKYEAIGGALMNEHCDIEAMNADSLDNILNRLDDSPSTTHKAHQKLTGNQEISKEIGFDLPFPISKMISEQSKALKWRSPYPGFKSYDFDIECETSIARFVQAKPGVKSPNHSHAGTEITVVLDGAFTDETGEYKVGDLIVTDETCEHAPIACKFDGCTCFVVTSAPIKLTGIASVLNPFLKP